MKNFPHTDFTLAGCSHILTAKQLYLSTHLSILASICLRVQHLPASAWTVLGVSEVLLLLVSATKEWVAPPGWGRAQVSQSCSLLREEGSRKLTNWLVWCLQRCCTCLLWWRGSWAIGLPIDLHSDLRLWTQAAASEQKNMSGVLLGS